MDHDQKVKSVASAIAKLSEMNSQVKIRKSVDSHFVPNPYNKRDRLPKIDISDLTEIIDIDVAQRTCTAESSATFADVVAATLKHGLIPYTVPELAGITLGGAISGCSIESMSYRYGGFHDSCIEYEVVTGSGEIITCSQNSNPLLFNMLHGSYGTLGVITKIKFKLLPAKKFVKMEYKKFSDFSSFWTELKDRCNGGDHDFVDAIIHSKSEFVICLGRMTDEAPYLSSYKWLNIFYKSTSARTEDYLTIEDYFFRYDTECHWLTKTVPLMETKPARLLFGKIVLGSTKLIAWSRRLKKIMKLKKRPEVIVDVFIPSQRFEEFFKWYENDFDFFPLWVVPYRAPELYPWLDDEYARRMGGTLFIDCAIYGKKNSDPEVDYSELLENKTTELGGIKTLISRNHFSEEEFWKIYNAENYHRVKAETDPNGVFLDLYKKFAPGNYR